MTDKPPTIEELRRVANYMSETMHMHQESRVLLDKADYLEGIVDLLIKYKSKDI